VQASQKGQSVFVIKSDQTADLRYVSARVMTTEAVIESGVQAGETVVTDGQLRLLPGTKVTPKEAALAVKSGETSASDKPAAGANR